MYGKPKSEKCEHVPGRAALVRGCRPKSAVDPDNCRSGWIGVGREIAEELRDGEAGAGFAKLRSDFVKRNEDEGTLGEARMGNFEIELPEDEIAVEKNVEIERAGAVGNGSRAVAAEFTLDCEQGVEKLTRGEVGFKRDNGVEEAGLIGKADGSGGVERRPGGDVAEVCKVVDGMSECGFRRAVEAGKVGAEGDVSEKHCF